VQDADESAVALIICIGAFGGKWAQAARVLVWSCRGVALAGWVITVLVEAESGGDGVDRVQDVGRGRGEDRWVGV
jgi:hypothetical protein